MSELLVLRRPRPPAVVPPLLSFTAGFIDSFTVLALFGCSWRRSPVVTSHRFSARSGRCRWLPLHHRNPDITAFLGFRLFPGASGHIPAALLTGRLPTGRCLPNGGE